MKKRLLTATAAMFVLFSCSQATEKSKSTEKSPVKAYKVSKEEEEIIRTLLKPLQVRGIEVKEIKPAPEVKVPGFKAFEVVVSDKLNAREVSKYIFLSKDDKFLTFEIFKVRREGKTIHIEPLRPKEAVKPLKVDLSWLKDVEKKLQENKVPFVVGKSDKKVYITWDVLCPFCYRHFDKVEEIAKKEGVELHMIPFPIHGEASIKGMIYYTKLAREKGVAGALKELYKLGDGDFGKYREKLEEITKKMELSEEDKKLEKFFKELRQELAEKGVRATPSMIYIPPGEKDKGYIIVGFKPIKELLKMK
jgi:thiol:disulfide interchange protein DsbC